MKLKLSRETLRCLIDVQMQEIQAGIGVSIMIEMGIILAVYTHQEYSGCPQALCLAPQSEGPFNPCHLPPRRKPVEPCLPPNRETIGGGSTNCPCTVTCNSCPG